MVKVYYTSLVNTKKVLGLVVVATVVLLAVLAVLTLRASDNAILVEVPPPDSAETSVSTIPMPAILYRLKTAYRLDVVDDSKALGYTGQQKIAVDSLGNIYITYRKKYQGAYELFVTKSVPLGSGAYATSGTSVPISVVGKDATQRVSSLAIAPDDTISVTWYGLDPDAEDLGRQIKYSQSADHGKTWTRWRNIAVVSGYDGEDYWQEHPEVTVANDYIFIVWEGKDAANEEQQIKFTRSDDGGSTFSPWKNVQPTPKNTQSRPSIVVDEDGWLHLFMYSSQSVSTDVQQIWHSVSKDNGDTWSGWENVSRSDTDARHVSAVVAKGAMLTVWRQQGATGEPAQLFFSVYSHAVWSRPTLLRSSSRYQLFPSLGRNKDGVFVAWVETPDSADVPRDNPGGSFGYIAHYDQATQQFSPPIPITLKQEVLYPHITTSDLGSIYVVYEKEESGKYGVMLTTLTSE
jgi:hypothetical protein